MVNLTDILLRDGVRQRLVLELAALIDHEVEGHGGLVGATLRGGYRLVCNLRGGPSFLHDALDDMIEDFVDELEPLFREHGSPRGFDQFLAAHRARVAQRMLKVTDERRSASGNPALRRAYDALTPLARNNVEQAVPRLAQVIQRFVDELAGEPALSAAPA